MRGLSLLIILLTFLLNQFASAQIDLKNRPAIPQNIQINRISQLSLNNSYTMYTSEEIKGAFIKSKAKNSRLIALIILITFIFSVFTYNLYTRQQKHIKKLKITIQQKHENGLLFEKKEIDIEKSTIESILIGLENFETELGFLKHNVSLVSLAKKIKTNPTYLSKVINTHKGKKLSDYLSDLRVDYLLSTLKTDPKLSLYTMKAIAYEIGFNNSQSFTNAFYKKTGAYPSRYIKQLKTIRLTKFELVS